tara:strand:- start:4720 stop:5418 length:699 start_codon:yes stop_codon:yes gene_type:complete
MTNTIKKKRKKKKSNQYFTQVHEDAILEYISCSDSVKKNELYSNTIRPVFVEMINKIVFTYKFGSLPNVDALKEECEIHLITILSNFDAAKGSKAFSYFSVVTKNWFIARVKKNAIQMKREAKYDEISKKVEVQYLSIYNEYEEDRNKEEFMSRFMAEVNNWEKKFNLKDNEKKILEAIKILFKESENIEIFNKKAIYLYIREMTNLNTKQILNNLKRFRGEYGSFKKKWNE